MVVGARELGAEEGRGCKRHWVLRVRLGGCGKGKSEKPRAGTIAGADRVWSWGVGLSE